MRSHLLHFDWSIGIHFEFPVYGIYETGWVECEMSQVDDKNESNLLQYEYLVMNLSSGEQIVFDPNTLNFPPDPQEKKRIEKQQYLQLQEMGYEVSDALDKYRDVKI